MRQTVVFLFLCTLAAGEIIDRVAVSAGNHTVTESEIRRYLRFAAFFGQREPDMSPEARRIAADRLIDQALIGREIELAGYTPPSMAEIETRIVDWRKRRSQTEADFQKALQRYGFTEEDLKREVQWQLTVIRFIDFRFRPGVQVSDEEVAEFYKKEFPQWLEKRGRPREPVPPLEEARSEITETLAEIKVTAAMEQWLAQARQQTPVRYREASFK